MNRLEAVAIARAAKQAKAPPLKVRFWTKVAIGNSTDCWLWKACVRKKTEGYGAFWLNRRHQPASKIAWILTYGEIENSLQVLHKCDNPRCCNPSHLFLGTSLDNNNDKVLKQRHVFGSKVGTAKLTAEQVIQIRELKQTKTEKEISEIFNISRRYVGEICRRESWKHL